MPKTLKPGGLVFRLLSTMVVAFLIVWRTLRLPGKWLPSRKLRNIHQYWSPEMQLNYLKSLGKKLPQDQLCVPRRPETFKPKVEAPPENRLSEKEIEAFYENGFLEPFTVFSEEEMKTFGAFLLEERKKVNRVYGFVADRDRHLQIPEMRRMIAHPAITDRLAQLLGPDLIAWRSQIFFKPPGDNPVGWHQASTYMFEEGFAEPSLFPPDTSDLFMLTVWIPADPATIENGCLKFLSGSLLEGIRWIRLGGKIGFHAVNYFPDYEVDEAKVKRVEMRPGQVLIFSERTVHGSDPNRTEGNRLAFNFRIVPTDVRVYPPGETVHRSSQMGESYDLKNWRPIVIRGKDDVRVNASVPWQDYA